MCNTCKGEGNLNEYLPYGVIVNACPDCKPSEGELRERDIALIEKFNEAYERLGIEKPDWSFMTRVYKEKDTA